MTNPIHTYQFHTETYGSAIVFYLATRKLQQIAVCEEITAATTYKSDFYLDDLITGADKYDNYLNSSGVKLYKSRARVSLSNDNGHPTIRVVV